MSSSKVWFVSNLKEVYVLQNVAGRGVFGVYDTLKKAKEARGSNYCDITINKFILNSPAEKKV